MLNFSEDTKVQAKCQVTHGVMGHLDPKQPPVKRKPFAAILSHKFVHKAELVLPEEIYKIINGQLVDEHPSLKYSRAVLPLKALLEEAFFNEYIKKGNVLMLSEGTLGVDNTFSLCEGVLCLHLDKESYERAGIIGRPDGVKGKRGTDSRWVVEVNLRLPSLFNGQKGFERLAYAFKNVLTTPITWLFLDLSTLATRTDPLALHFPEKRTVTPHLSRAMNIGLPVLRPPGPVGSTYDAVFEDYAIELQEWLSLFLLESPRVELDDKIDPFLSRCTLPRNSRTKAKLVKLTWQGFISPHWAHEFFVRLLLLTPQESWFVFCVGGFGDGIPGNTKNSTIVRLPDAPNEYILWEVA